MSRTKLLYQCQSCGFSSPKWLGKCPDCGEWNTFTEEEQVVKLKSRKASAPVVLSDITHSDGQRFSTGISELDRTLGGGVVMGSVVLLGGDPGIGKSTLILQSLPGLTGLGSVLYVSGEESPEQIKIRADRLNITSDKIILLPETSLEGIISVVQKERPSVIIIDSIQTIFSLELSSAPGSVSQIRDCSTKLMFLAKKHNIPLFIIGHVTKDGAIAGPKILEHIVDTVLYFEGDKGNPFRILRAVKNRFGSTNEIGVFEMVEAGLQEVANPSELFLSERPVNVPGSVVTVSLEGTRPLLIEMQALVTSSSFGVPRRTALGVDYNRISLLLAVLDKRLGMKFGSMDVYVNVVGGLKLNETAVDMGMVASIVSSFRNKPVDTGIFTFGEIGLSGELRAVSQAGIRIREAAKLGFKKGIIPAGNASNVEDHGIELIGVKNVEEAVEILMF
ncbi:MAG: DNA repair protein RadA [Nitrospira sp.]|nr:DNA repair protein RadA [bacterium]MBL7048468.1 DNA repair protein RadA [Nitrospira sp.]